MKILHLSDTHLGYSAYRKATPDGINQREIDTYNAFNEFIDYAVKTKPDLIIHSGDLFDSVRPNNRAITFSIDQILRLSKKKIPIIIIAGNHEHPKLKETGHIFSIFDHIENVYPVYKAKYEIIDFQNNGKNISIHVVPQCELKRQFEDEIKKLKPKKSSNYNIFVSHGAISGIKEFSMNEFNELIIPVNVLSKNFNYIALGHYHKFTKLADNAYYSGSTEKFSFSDASDKKGFIEIKLVDDNLDVNFIELNIREMKDLKPIRCTNLKLDEVMTKIRKTMQEINPNEKTFRITLDDVPSHIYRGIDFGEIRKLSSKAIHFEIKANVKKEGESEKSSTSKIDALTNEFKRFVENQDLKERDTILELGICYIEKIEAREEGK